MCGDKLFTTDDEPPRVKDGGTDARLHAPEEAV